MHIATIKCVSFLEAIQHTQLPVMRYTDTAANFEHDSFFHVFVSTFKFIVALNCSSCLTKLCTTGTCVCLEGHANGLIFDVPNVCAACQELFTYQTRLSFAQHKTNILHC